MSVLANKHPLIKKANDISPAIPLAYFFHERKTEETHFDFFIYIKSVFPEIEFFCFIVTDDELSFRNAVKKVFPEIKILRCWKHLWGSVERWIRSHSGKVGDLTFYIDSFRELFLQPTN